MRDIYAMVFAANLVCAILNVLEGSATGVAFNGLAAALCFICWRDRRADDLREEN